MTLIGNSERRIVGRHLSRIYELLRHFLTLSFAYEGDEVSSESNLLNLVEATFHGMYSVSEVRYLVMSIARL
jgi:hypothetical protein